MRRTFYLGLFCITLLCWIAPTAKANVRFSVDSTSIDFGSVLLSNNKEITVTITDTSDSVVEILDISPFAGASSEFAIVSPASFPQTLSPGESLAVKILFTPSTTGNRTTLLEIQSADGNMAIIMIGTGATENSGLSLPVISIDVGKVAPNFFKDTVIQVLSTGSDSATINGVVVANGGADTSFTAYIDGVSQYPYRLAPAASAPLRIRFTGLLPTGLKQGLLSVAGSTNPSLLLNGEVEWGSFEYVPSTMDFGAMYIGEQRDSIVYLKNTGDVDIEVIEFNPTYGSFSYIDAPAVPFILRAHDSIAVKVRANPGIGTYNVPDVDSYSPNVPSRPKGYFNLSPKWIGLEGPHSQHLTYPCAAPGAIDVTVPIYDSVGVPFYITKVVSLDTLVSISSDVSLPDTISAFQTRSYPLHVDASRRSRDTVILVFYAGNRPVVYDTLYLQGLPSQASVSLLQVPSADTNNVSFDVRAATDLAQYALDTLIVHLAVTDSNALEIDTNSILLSASLPNARIVRIEREQDGYAIWIASSTAFDSHVGGAILSVSYKRFVSATDSAYLRVAVDAPERSGCLSWTGDRSLVPLSPICGSTMERQLMAGNDISLRVVKNPAQDRLDLLVRSTAAETARIEVRNVLGQLQFQDFRPIGAGTQTLEYPIQYLRSGAYYISATLSSGRKISLTFVKE